MNKRIGVFQILLAFAWTTSACEDPQVRYERERDEAICQAHHWLADSGYSKLKSNVTIGDIPKNTFGRIRAEQSGASVREFFAERFDSFSGARLSSYAYFEDIHIVYFNRYGSMKCVVINHNAGPVLGSNKNETIGLTQDCHPNNLSVELSKPVQKISKPTAYDCQVID